MLKKFLSVLLTVMMVISVMSVAVVTTGAADVELQPNMLYLDTEGSGWTVDAKSNIGFYVFSLTNGERDVLPWGDKKLKSTAVKDADGNFTGVFSYDPAKRGMKLNDGEQYGIIFTFGSIETYSLLFDTTCLGHIAHVADFTYENPVDSSKKSVVAFWDDSLDPAVYGPRLQISSTGNVIGTCVEEGKTAESVFTDFLVSETAQGLANARKYTVDVGTKTEQQLIDDIGTGLGLTKSFVRDAFAEAGIETPWSYDASTLPAGEQPHEHTPAEPIQENVKPASCTEEGSYDEVVYCSECGEELSREAKTIEKTAHTPGEPARENEKPASCTEEGSYDEVVKCTVCGEELSREAKTIEKTAHTPGEPVRENEKPASCTEEGSYDEVVKCTVCGEELSREAKTIEKTAHTLSEVAEVPATEEAAGTKAHSVCSVCGKFFIDGEEVTAEDLVIAQLAHTHEAGEAVKENEKPATCTEKGSYDLVVRCTKCGEELSRDTIETDMIPHTIVFVAEVPATTTVDGMKEHYECSVCGKLFADATGTVEVTAEDLVIKAELVRGDADESGDLDVTDATVIQRVLAEIPVEKYNRQAADADLDGEVSIIDVTLIQRVVAKMITFERWDELHAA